MAERPRSNEHPFLSSNTVIAVLTCLAILLSEAESCIAAAALCSVGGLFPFSFRLPLCLPLSHRQIYANLRKDKKMVNISQLRSILPSKPHVKSFNSSLHGSVQIKKAAVTSVKNSHVEWIHPRTIAALTPVSHLDLKGAKKKI